MQPIDLTFIDLATASSLIFLCAGLSLAMALRTHRQLLWAAARMVAQLLLIGFVLRLVFAAANPWLTGVVVVAMGLAASYEVGARQRRRLARAWNYGVGGGATVLSTAIIVVLALTTALRPHPWYDARHALPLTGIILGGVMNAVSLALNALFNDAVRERAGIEAQLALGATRFQALHGLAAQAIRTALIPTINQMMAAGVITLPGIMTGQLLAGMDPMSAAKYQILLMFLLVGGNCLGAFAAVFLVVLRITDARHRLRLDRLQARG